MLPFLRDLRYALRQLRNAPVFAATAIFTLALGIGANAAMFSVIDQVLLHRMPFLAADRVVQMAVQSPQGHFAPTSLPDIEDWRARSHAFQHIGYFTEQFPTLGGASDARLVPQVACSANLFDLLQVKPMLGRTFAAPDEIEGHTNVVVLGADTWQQIYHGDRQILGRAVPINGIPYTVIGVMPAGFAFPVNAGALSIWTPIPAHTKELEDRGSAALSVIGRLGDGVTIDQASREINSIHNQLKKEYPKDEDSHPIRVQSYPDAVTGRIRPAILALNAAVLAVWLIACANVAGLLLARGNGRRREMALRTALGATRGRLLRQFFTENLLLSLAGGALGLGFAVVALRILRHYLENAMIFGDQVHIDWRVGAYLLLASCLSAVLFGFLPALHASRVPAQEGLRQGTVGAGTSRKQALWRDGLVVSEIALTLVLLVAAGLLIRNLSSLRSTPLGFVPDQVTTGSIYLPSHSALFINAVPEAGANLVQTFYAPLLQRLKALPGVQSAGLTTVRPLQTNWDFNLTVEIEGQPKPEHSAQADAQTRETSADYFQTMGIRLLRGRFFATSDASTGQPFAIVNHAFVQRFFPDKDPLGQRIRFNDEGSRQWATVVGIIEDNPQKNVGQPALPEIDFDLAQLLPTDDLYSILGTWMMNIAVRSPLPAATLDQELHRIVRGLEPGAALDGVQSMNAVVDDALGDQVLAARLLGLFAVTGLVIAVAGIYGLLAYTVSQRTRELGVRIALGAQREALLWLILKHALVLLGSGLVLGAFISAGSAKLLASVLPYHFGGDDGTVLIIVAALLSLCGLAASYIPARRAAHIDPVVSLRTD